MKIKDITQVIEKLAPLSFQESYDNAGLQVGNPEKEIKTVLLTLDITEEVIEEAKRKKVDLIICHHPVIFGGIKKLTGRNATERIVIDAIKNDIAIYTSHTNLDSTWGGVNIKLAEKLGLKNISILKPVVGTLKKLVTFVPIKQAEKVRLALFEAGAGNIGNYDSCSFNTEGKGTFRAGEGANPFVGEKDELHSESELRVETIFPSHLRNKVIAALLENHPYEEVAYDIYPLENIYNKQGIGSVGYLPYKMTVSDFLGHVKQKLNCIHVKYSGSISNLIGKVAICGGSGAFLISDALTSGADAFVTADLKYHQFFESEKQLLLVDAGHFETEQHSIEIFYDLLKNNFPTFAIYFSEVNTSPVNYFYNMAKEKIKAPAKKKVKAVAKVKAQVNEKASVKEKVKAPVKEKVKTVAKAKTHIKEKVKTSAKAKVKVVAEVKTKVKEKVKAPVKETVNTVAKVTKKVKEKAKDMVIEKVEVEVKEKAKDMVKEKVKVDSNEVSIEDRLRALNNLQAVDSQVDRIKTLRGELPLEVQDLEDEIVGLQTRLTKFEDESKEFEKSVIGKRAEIKQAEVQIKKYTEQQNNVRNNREYDALSKEIEFQQLEIQLCEKRIREFTLQVNEKKVEIETARNVLEERQKDLDLKLSELKEITEETQKEEDLLMKKSIELEKVIDPRLLSAYTRIRQNARNGLAVVGVERDSCGGCFNKIPPQRQMEIKSRKKIIVCEYCGRIIVDPEVIK